MCIEDQNLSESEMFLPSFRRIKLNNSVQWCYIWFSGWFLVRILSIAWSTEVVPQHHIHILAHLKTNKQTNTKAKQKQTTKNTGSIKFTIDSKSNSDWNEPLGDHSVSPTAQSESDWIMLLRALSRWILNISKDSLDLSAGLPPVWSCLSSMRVPNTRHCFSLINIVKKRRELSISPSRANGQHVVRQDLQSLSRTAAFQPVVPQHVLVHGVIQPWAQDINLVLFNFLTFLSDLVLLKRCPSLHCIAHCPGLVSSIHIA